MSAEVHTCPTCGHESAAYWRRITKGNVESLIKFRQAIGRLDRNEVHLYRDMDGTENELTASQKMNWTNLRFFGLVAKVKEDGQHKRGYWLLTHRGSLFLRGQLAIPVKVKTLDNRKVDETEETLKISDIIKGAQPYFDDIYEIEREVQPLSLTQAELFA